MNDAVLSVVLSNQRRPMERRAGRLVGGDRRSNRVQSQRIRTRRRCQRTRRRVTSSAWQRMPGTPYRCSRGRWSGATSRLGRRVCGGSPTECCTAPLHGVRRHSSSRCSLWPRQVRWRACSMRLRKSDGWAPLRPRRLPARFPHPDLRQPERRARGGDRGRLARSRNRAVADRGAHGGGAGSACARRFTHGTLRPGLTPNVTVTRDSGIAPR